MEYKDYYATMGVERDADQETIKRAYRRLARKYHPDVSKEADAEVRFKEVGEAYAVLRDPEKRAGYDQLGAEWQSGQEFRPPPDWDSGFEFHGSGADADDASAYSDFFESLFGGFRQSGTRGTFRARGEDHHARVSIHIEDAYLGATRSITLQAPVADEHGKLALQQRTLNVQIPKGVRQGQRIRLAGQGSAGSGGADAGDLYLEIAFDAHDLYTVDDRDVYFELPVAPWEAALGAKIKTPTPTGPVDLTIPKGTSSGRRLRLKGRGIPGNPPGDLYATISITVPPADSDAAMELYRRMERELGYNPRRGLGV